MTLKTELDPRFSTPEATAATWDQAVDLLTKAQVYWLSTVRPSGQPHVTPLIAVWHGTSAYFCTGPSERKANQLDTHRLVPRSQARAARAAVACQNHLLWISRMPAIALR